MIMSGEIEDALIVAPLSSKGSWERDIDKLSPVRKNAAKRLKIVNYDMVWRREEYNRSWGALVLDECHAICHRNSKRSKFLLKLSTKVDHRVLLSGTPISNGKLEQYYSLLSFLEPSMFTNYREFAERYLVERQLPSTFVKIIVDYRNKDELLEIVGRYSYRVTKDECLDLPDKLPDEIIYCPLKEKKMYKEAMKSFISEYEMNMPNPLSKITKLRQIPNGFIVDDYGEVHEIKTDKDKLLGELVESILPNKVVIFCEYKHSIKLVCEVLDKLCNYVILNGDQKDKNIWREFQSNGEIQAIVCQYRTANAGIDLFASSHMIFFEPNLSSTVISQATDRIHRVGTKNHCSYYWLITEDTIEIDIYNRLKNFEDFNKECLNVIANVHH